MTTLVMKLDASDYSLEDGRMDENDALVIRQKIINEMNEGTLEFVLLVEKNPRIDKSALLVLAGVWKLLFLQGGRLQIVGVEQETRQFIEEMGLSPFLLET
ncbi:STAS domain-containing protein [Ammoniphilus sp. CFH 90114]|uniref:STAS domain-containing protein n=1 Tax=Ammoniphilus sp. CFH 90114 TaxID=2493665 RepID=UPI00100F6346|nr:STAS domain-containing protein [Ammoniphilus sp. CFH 90114]RXT02882.1 hypothetical protein EIZ39_24130 [Ammoniphilus sp. CFH 90114]